MNFLSVNTILKLFFAEKFYFTIKQCSELKLNNFLKSAFNSESKNRINFFYEFWWKNNIFFNVHELEKNLKTEMQII